MGNITDYIAWRGDLSLKVAPFNHIDSLVLCQLLYAYLDDIVPKVFSTSITISQTADLYKTLNRTTLDLGLLINNKTANLLATAGSSIRFGQIKLCAFVNDINIEQEKQFAAFTAILPDGKICVVYRGTDDTLIGWKEDFNMTFLNPVPSQCHAVEYIEWVASHSRGQMLIMGHSKGGNLAAYATAFCKPNTARRILEVFNNDGPGFISEIISKPSFIEMTKKLRTIIPQSSIVGVLLKHPYEFMIIESSEGNGIAQHDIFSWQVEGTKFITTAERSKDSIVTEMAVKAWLEAVEHKKRKEFIQELFTVLDATEAKTLAELNQNWIKNSATVIKSMHEMKKETKDQIFKIIKIFFESLRIKIPSIKELF